MQKWLDILLLLGLGLFMRLWQIDLTHFDLDQSTLLANVTAFLDTGQIPTASGNVYSVGGAMMPLITFIYALPSLVNRDPIFVIGFQAALDSLGIAFLYWLGRDLGNRWTGFATGLIYAVLPTAILHARVIWNPYLIDICSAAALWGAVRFLRSGRPVGLATALLALGLAVQLHPSAAALLPAVMAAMVARWRDVSWRAVALGLVLAALPALPYLVREAETGWSDVETLVAASAAGSDEFSLRSVDTAVLLVAGDFSDVVTRRTLPLRWPPDLSPSAELIVAAVAVGALRAFGRPGGWLLPLWAALPILMTARSPDPLSPHYLEGLIPAAAVLAGLGVAWLWRPLGLILLTGLVVVQIRAEEAFLRGVDAGEYVGVQGVPLRYEQIAARSLLDLSGSVPFFVGETHGHGGIFHFLTQDRLDPRTFDGTTGLLLRDGGGVYLVESDSGAARVLGQSFGPPLERIGSASYSFYDLHSLAPAAQRSYLAGLHVLDGDIGGVLRLRGYQAASLHAGQPADLALVWEVMDPSYPAWDTLRTFAELVDVQSKPRSSRLDRPLPHGPWQPGDVVVDRLELQVDPDLATAGYWLRTGFYRLPGFEVLPYHLAGQSGDGTLRLGPVKVPGQGPTVPQPSQRLAVFGNQEIALTGLEQVGGQVRLTWLALRKPLVDYTVFVHLLSPTGELVAQEDGQPQGGAYPTSLWDPAETITDLHNLTSNPTTGQLIEIGLYSGPNATRLAATGSGGAPLADGAYRVTIGSAG